jgi:nicotinate-nucleotide pyrophosphorylase (carboxylating)
VISRTPYGDLPRVLIEELAGAGLDPERVYSVIVTAFDEDLPRRGRDVTSEAMPAMGCGRGVIAAREAGVVAGLAVAELAFAYAMDQEFHATDRVADGSRVAAGEVVMRVEGPVRDLLTAERTALNLASHLSGVATATSQWVEAVAGTRAQVLDTRKTLPGLRALQKYAVRCGGGSNHRFSLSDRALVKDNHVVAAGGVVPAYELVREANPNLRVEVEVTDLDQLCDLLEAGCTEILLDNMDMGTMTEAVRLTAGRATLEASGGLTLDRAREVAETGVDFISVGALTHSVKVLDLGLDLP